MGDFLEEALYYQFGEDVNDEIDSTDHYHRDHISESRSSDGISMAEEAFLLGYEEYYEDN